jgi:hypothetical protein
MSPSSEATIRLVTREFPQILWNPDGHLRIYKNPPLVSIQNQLNPVHTTPFYPSKIHFNIILLPTSRYS